MAIPFVDSNYISGDSIMNWLSTAFAYTAMTDYPTPSNFLSAMPAYPVKQVSVDQDRIDDTMLEKISFPNHDFFFFLSAYWFTLVLSFVGRGLKYGRSLTYHIEICVVRDDFIWAELDIRLVILLKVSKAKMI